MNIRLLFKLLGILSCLIGLVMLASLIWSNPRFGYPTDSNIETLPFESQGFRGLIYSSLIAATVGVLLLYLGRNATGKLFRKEAMAVVGLSWIIATILGAMPFVLSETYRSSSIRIFSNPNQNRVMVVAPGSDIWSTWLETEISPQEFAVLRALDESNAKGISQSALIGQTGLQDAETDFL